MHLDISRASLLMFGIRWVICAQINEVCYRALFLCDVVHIHSVGGLVESAHGTAWCYVAPDGSGALLDIFLEGGVSVIAADFPSSFALLLT